MPTPKISEKFPLKDLDVNLLMEIMNKMPVKELVRMRRTCKQMNSFIEKNNKKFASRPKLGVRIEIKTVGDKIVFFYPHMISPTMKYWATVKRVDEWYEIRDMLSGISFSEIYVEFPWTPELVDKFIDILKGWQPVCYELTGSTIPHNHIAAVTNNLTVVGPHEYVVRDIDGKRHTDSFLAFISKAKKLSEFHVKCSKSGIACHILERFKRFGRAKFTATIDGFHDLLWDLHNCKERIRMKSLKIDISPRASRSSTPKSFPYTTKAVPPFRTIQSFSFEDVDGMHGIYEMDIYCQTVIFKETYFEFNRTNKFIVVIEFKNRAL